MTNLSVSTGVYPKKLKIAKIIPIFKPDKNTDANKFFCQLISIECLRNRSSIEWHLLLRKKSLLSPSLYGFHKAHSTHHAVLDIVNTIQTNMDEH